jgi:hypothetical protein
MSSSTEPKTVLLRGDPLHGEAAAATGSNIVPGMLIEKTTAGTVRPHSVAGGEASIMFARELEFAGGSIDDVYENADRVPFFEGRKADWFYAFLAAGENVAISAPLQSDGAGAFEAVDGEGQGLVRALEAVNNTGESAVRIKVGVI